MRAMSLGVIAALLLPLASARAGPDRTAAAGEAIVIGMPTVDAAHPVHATLQKTAEDEARGLGAQVEVTECFGNPFEQTNAILEFVARGVKGIVLVPLHDVSPAMEAATKAGVVVVTVGDRANTDKVLLQSGPDNVEAGRIAARFIVEKLGNKGSVIEIEGGGAGVFGSNAAATDLKLGFDEVIQKSGVKLLASRPANWNRTLGRGAMEALMKEHPSFDAVYAANDDMILGAIDALSAAGIDPSTKVTVGVNASPAALESIKAGKLAATVDPMLAKQARQAVDYLVGYVKTKKMPPRQSMLVQPELVTR